MDMFAEVRETSAEVAIVSSDDSQTVTPPAQRKVASTIEKHVQRRIFKIIVIGDSNVGKTCLTYRFCSGKFPTKTEATIGVDFREKVVEVDGETIKLQLWDTAGQERFRKSMVPHYYRNAHAIIFVYDVTRPESFESLPGWIGESEAHGLDSSIPRLMVGNKCDEMSEVAKCVTSGVSQRFADAHTMPLFETSAKDDTHIDHVDAIFMTLALKLKNRKPLMSNAGCVLNAHKMAPPRKTESCSC